jgi:lipopolysaccharide/colanic/teichoic acid biosynthesis glycosyltransferase
MPQPTNTYLLGTPKRVVDLLLCLMAGPVALILVFIGAVLLIFPTGGRAFYSQKRVGLLGQTYTIYKLRTLKQSATHDKAGMSKDSDDFVPFGRWLRRWRIDELPQILNIVKGDMSWIGPRPERPHIHDTLVQKEPTFAHRLEARPGITGWAQVHLPNATPDQNMDKLPYDMKYIEVASFSMDAGILIKTLTAIL